MLPFLHSYYFAVVPVKILEEQNVVEIAVQGDCLKVHFTNSTIFLYDEDSLVNISTLSHYNSRLCISDWLDHLFFKLCDHLYWRPHCFGIKFEESVFVSTQIDKYVALLDFELEWSMDSNLGVLHLSEEIDYRLALWGQCENLTFILIYEIYHFKAGLKVLSYIFALFLRVYIQQILWSDELPIRYYIPGTHLIQGGLSRNWLKERLWMKDVVECVVRRQEERRIVKLVLRLEAVKLLKGMLNLVRC